MKQTGFTLIELMIVVAIIGILAAIAVPQYQAYTVKSAEKSCLMEVKGYANSVFVILNSPGNEQITPPIKSACSQVTDASGWTTLQDTITATPQSPGQKNITCYLNSGVNCRIN